MARLSMTDVGRHAKAAGFTGKDLTIAIAVAYAESQGNPDAIGDGGKSIGLMQIHLPSHPQYTKAQMLDPGANMRAAKQIQSSGRGWMNWTQYRLGIYALYMPQAEVAAQRIEPKGGILAAPAQAGTRLPDTSAGIQAPWQAVTDAIRFLSVGRNWGRIAEITLGGILLVVALSILARPVTEPLAKTAVKGAKLTATKGVL